MDGGKKSELQGGKEKKSKMNRRTVNIKQRSKNGVEREKMRDN